MLLPPAIANKQNGHARVPVILDFLGALAVQLFSARTRQAVRASAIRWAFDCSSAAIASSRDTVGKSSRNSSRE